MISSTNLLLILANEFEKNYLQVSTFANKHKKLIFPCIHLHQIDQNWRKFEKLVPQRFAFNKTDIFKVIF